MLQDYIKHQIRLIMRLIKDLKMLMLIMELYREIVIIENHCNQDYWKE